MRFRDQRGRFTRRPARDGQRESRLLGERPAFDGDFPAREPVTEAMARVPDWQAAPPWYGASGAGLPDDTLILYGSQSRSVMAVHPPRPGDRGPTEQAIEVARFLRSKVRIMQRRREPLYQVEDEKAIVGEAVTLLLPDRPPWEPSPAHQAAAS